MKRGIMQSSSPSSSPTLKHRRVEEPGTFVPPPFHAPLQPPVKGFPDEADIILPEARRGGTVDGKTLLLNSSPTLELPKEEGAALLMALRQHPKFASMQEQVNNINEAYLEEIFGDEDAREEDTRRRVDYQAATALLKSNSSKRLSTCVSCLTRGQHRHYRSWVITYMRTGIMPKASEDYPDMSIVIDLVQREQTAYLHKFMEETITCEACNMETGYKKRLSKAEGTPASHRSCWNHNYIDEHVEQFAKRWWRYRRETRIQRCFSDSEANNNGTEGDDDSFREVIFDLKKGVAALAAAIGSTKTNATTTTSTSSREGGVGVMVKPTAMLTSRTRQLAARCTTRTIAQRESRGERRCPPTVSIPPSFPLDVRRLCERKPQLYYSHPLVDSEQRKQKGDEGKGEEEEEAKRGLENVLPPVRPVKSLPNVFFSLRVCKSALVELAAAHLSSCRADFRLPVRCVWHPSERRVDISIDKPLPGSCESRRNISAAVLKRLVDDEPRFPSNSRCSLRDGEKTKCCTEVSFGDDMTLHSLSNCVYDLTNQCPVFRMVKMEYNCKGYNTVPDDEKTFNYESFSKREVVRMLVLLHCNPTAILYVYRINAYSSAVIGIEQFSAVSFMSQVMGSWSNDVEIMRTWSSLREVLQSTVSAVARRLQLPEGSNNGKINATYILSKEKENGNVSLCSVKACYPPQSGPLDDDNNGTAEYFLEPSSRAVCRREYLAPCVWPFPDRIPYTYGPAPKACYAINRTTETRHDSTHYAKHDVWTHETRYYIVGEDGIIGEMQPSSS